MSDKKKPPQTHQDAIEADAKRVVQSWESGDQAALWASLTRLRATVRNGEKKQGGEA